MFCTGFHDTCRRRNKGANPLMSEWRSRIDAYYFQLRLGVTNADEDLKCCKGRVYLQSVPCKFGELEPWSHWSVEIPWETIEKKAKHQDKNSVLTAITINTKKWKWCSDRADSKYGRQFFQVLKNEYEIRQFFSPEGCTITEDGTETEGGKLLPKGTYFELWKWKSSPWRYRRVLSHTYKS